MMKFTIERDHLKNGLAQVAGVVGSGKNTAAQLNNVLIEAEGDSVAMTTTNLDITIRARVSASVVSGGVVTLPVKLLASIVATLPGNRVEVEVNANSRATITCGRSKFNINGLPGDDFHVLTGVTADQEYELPAADVAALLDKVAHAQSTDDGRFILQGVFFDFGAGKLALAATDGRRLATASKATAAATEHSGKFILSSRAVTEVQRVIKGANVVRIVFNDRNVSFIAALTEEQTKDTGLIENIHLVAKLVEGTYPNYVQVIPKETIHRIEIERAVLLDAIRSASVVLNSEKSKTLKFTIDSNQIHIAAEAAETGDGSAEIEVKYDGPVIKIAFNPDYLSQPLDALKDNNVIFEFKDDLSPGVLKGADDFLCVIMPQRSSN